MSKIRIVHALYSFGTGGMEKGIVELLRHSSSIFEHIVLCFSTSGESERLLPPGTTVVELQKPFGNSFRFLQRLVRTIGALKPDIVHSRNWGGLDAIVAARLAGIPNVIHGEHGWDIGDAGGNNPKRRLIRRLASRWVTHYTCVSNHIRNWLQQEIGITKPVTQIYNGVDSDRYFPGRETGIKAALGISESSILLGTVGRLDPIKDHPTLFRAFADARKCEPGLHLVVAGHGPEQERLERIAGEGVFFLGNRSDVPRILRNLDIFILPSLNEGISNTLLEAMATGLPIVATSVGGNSELIDNGVNGTLVPPRAAEAMVTALKDYLDDPSLRQAHGRAALEKARRNFKIEQMVHSYERLYQMVVGC